MLRRPAVLLVLAVACAAATVALWFLATDLPAGRRLDARVADALQGDFEPSLDALVNGVESLADTLPFTVGAVALVALAWLRGGARLALVVAFVLLSANAVTQLLLQPNLAELRKVDFSNTSLTTASSWPSGHATAAMLLALGAILIAGPRLRAVTAAGAGVFALAVGGALVARGHLPSEVIAGFFVAATFVALGATVLAALRGSRDDERTRSVVLAPALGLLAAASVLGAGVGKAAVTRREEFTSALDNAFPVVAAVALIVTIAIAIAIALLRRSRS